MKNYKYIIVGGGMTGSAAVLGIRKNDTIGSIAMFTDEQYGPYNRPPLTKGLWNGMQIEDIIRPTEKYHVDLYLETGVDQLNPDDKSIITEKGELFHYEKLLLATGGHPIQLPNVPEGIISYRTRADYLKVKKLSESKQNFCVIGGGFIGSEITAALTKHGSKVTMIFPEIGISGLVFPDDLSEYLNDYYKEKGVNVIARNLVDSINKEKDNYIVQYKDVQTGSISEEKFDVVIVGIGIKPNTELAEKTKFDVDNGILVNEYLQTNFSDVYAAGDVANFFHQGLGKRMRVEHEDNANKMGTIAGENMSGKKQIYDHFPFFYSDLFDLGYEAVGELNKDYQIYEDWIEPFKKGTIFYMKDQKVHGLIFWNLWGKVDQGRDIITKGESYQTADLDGLFKDD
jgi:3-phenylpropionate/trans-cinnamate dioxygenase ferredoxin reductase component